MIQCQLIPYVSGEDIAEIARGYAEIHCVAHGDHPLKHRVAVGGKIIDNLGLRGYTVGGAKISEHHANIIVNSGHATAQDVKDLVSLVEDKVREATGFQLEREIIYV